MENENEGVEYEIGLSEIWDKLENIDLKLDAIADALAIDFE